MNSKIMTLLGFAAKAGKLAFGMDAATFALKGKKSHLIIVAADLSEKSRKEISFFAEKAAIEVLELLENGEALSYAVGKKCSIISVNDKGFKESILKVKTN